MAKETHILPVIAHRLFAPPHLSRKLISFFVGCMITIVLLILIRQPKEYWYSYKYGMGEWISPLLAIHPLLFIGVAFVAMIIIVLLLDGLSLFPAFILWLPINFFLIIYISMTTIWILYQHKIYLVDWAQELLYLAISVVLAGIMGLLVGKTSFADARLRADTGTRRLLAGAKVPRIILISGITIWFLFLSFSLYRNVSAPVSRWQLITSKHAPAPRSAAAIAYDASRGRAVLFGGFDDWPGTLFRNDTWEWDGKDWEKMIIDLQPSPRAYFSMAYDEINKNIILFGGESNVGCLNDTWIWDGEAWAEAHPSTPPPARCFHQLLYDPQRQKIVLYGGYNGEYLNDGWEWDGEEWQAIHFDTFSPNAYSFLMFYDQALNRIVAHISWDGTWYWKGTGWGKPRMDVNPRILGLPVAYDPHNQRAVVFVGYKDEQFMHETWIYKNMNWRKFEFSFEPITRKGQATFYDPARKKVIVFGG